MEKIVAPLYRNKNFKDQDSFITFAVKQNRTWK